MATETNGHKPSENTIMDTQVNLLFANGCQMARWQQFVKRAMDLLVPIIFSPIVIPVCLITAIAIKLDSPGPVLFRQTRIGKNGQPFTLFKFRSMHKDAERMRKELESLNEASGPIFKIRNDPRITRVGRILRKTSLDELPQLINVIKGEMSLVGPRPP
jgi:lipopolysaccharide/colanic/teichoic acid biosynthesis glycosyltransferase